MVGRTEGHEQTCTNSHADCKGEHQLHGKDGSGDQSRCGNETQGDPCGALPRHLQPSGDDDRYRYRAGQDERAGERSAGEPPSPGEVGDERCRLLTIEEQLDSFQHERGQSAAQRQAAEQSVAAAAQDREQHGDDHDDNDELDESDQEPTGRCAGSDASDGGGVGTE